MKSLKMLGLSVIAAMGLMAFLGAGTASATTLCKTKLAPGVTCPTAWDWPVNTTSLHISLRSGKKAELTSPVGKAVATCEELTVTATLTKTSATWLPFSIHTLDWSKCSTTVTNIKLGNINVMWLKENEAEVQAEGVEVTVILSGVTCTYTTGEGTKLGTIVGGEKPTMKIETKVKKSAGSFVCPTEPTWDSEVEITEPNPINITE
jgi:hypothetical protein